MSAGELTPYQEQVRQADNLRWADKHHALIAGLRDGSLVAVPREPTRGDWDRVAAMCGAVPGSTWQMKAEAMWPEISRAFATLAASEAPRDE